MCAVCDSYVRVAWLVQFLKLLADVIEADPMICQTELRSKSGVIDSNEIVDKSIAVTVWCAYVRAEAFTAKQQHTRLRLEGSITVFRS